MGGTRPEVVLPIIAGTPIRYYPFPGEIEGHPSRLCGTVDGIVASAAGLLRAPGVHGLDLLAYRFEGDAPALMRRVCSVAGERPVIMAGSIDQGARIEAAIAAGAAGFTVGTAALDGVFPGSPLLADQLAFITGVAQGAPQARSA
jgi:4-hydroxythreonine-4-phosphate dehydrogenase